MPASAPQAARPRRDPVSGTKSAESKRLGRIGGDKIGAGRASRSSPSDKTSPRPTTTGSVRGPSCAQRVDQLCSRFKPIPVPPSRSSPHQRRACEATGQAPDCRPSLQTDRDAHPPQLPGRHDGAQRMVVPSGTTHQDGRRPGTGSSRCPSACRWRAPSPEAAPSAMVTSAKLMPSVGPMGAQQARCGRNVEIGHGDRRDAGPAKLGAASVDQRSSCVHHALGKGHHKISRRSEVADLRLRSTRTSRPRAAKRWIGSPSCQREVRAIHHLGVSHHGPLCRRRVDRLSDPRITSARAAFSQSDSRLRIVKEN